MYPLFTTFSDPQIPNFVSGKHWLYVDTRGHGHGKGCVIKCICISLDIALRQTTYNKNLCAA